MRTWVHAAYLCACVVAALGATGPLQTRQNLRPPQGFSSHLAQGQPLRQQIASSAEELEEEEKEEPDRLTELLPQSKFSCQGKRTGYYADEGLDCEVFHYCQDDARHSWICPEGFLFHQVHLICMPPSSDNICTESSQFHFVNDYLYKPINAEEVERKPNVTLRYSERYYPENVYSEETYQPYQQQRQQHNYVQDQRERQVSQPQRQPPQQVRHEGQPQHHPSQHHQPHRVFHSPEEVDIPLQLRRPTSQPIDYLY